MQIVNIVTYVVALHHVMSPMSAPVPMSCVLVPNIVLGGERDQFSRPARVSVITELGVRGQL